MTEEQVNLTNEQTAAIQSGLEPSLVLAGAGTGKTSVMAQRVLWLVQNQNIEASQILGLTFTNKAAFELKTRIRDTLNKNIEDYDFVEPNVSTYHSFALQILNDHGLLIGVESDLKPVNETTRVSLAYQVVLNTKNKPINLDIAPRNIAKQLLILDNQMAEHDLSLHQVIENSHEILEIVAQTNPRQAMRDLAQVTNARIELAQLVMEFRQRKREEGVLDFADQMRFCLELTRNHPEIVQQLRSDYKAVLLDEYQDTSVIQRMLLLEIFGNAHPVTAVGDPLQAIYGWRGASVSNIDNFVNDFKKGDGSPANKYLLTSNFRSGQTILNHANELSINLRNIHQDIKSLEAGKKIISKVKVGLHSTWVDEVASISNQIQELVFEQKVEPRKIAVLSRNSHELLAIYDSLISRGVSCVFSGKRDLADVPEVSEVLSYLRLLDDPTHNPSLVRILAGPRFEINPRDLALLNLRASDLVKDVTLNRNNRSLSESLNQSVSGIDVAELSVLSDALNSPGDYQYGTGVKERFKKINFELEILRKHITEPLSDIIFRIINFTGLLTEILASEEFMAQSRYEALMSLQDLAEGFDQGSPHGVVREFLAWISEADDLNSPITYQPATSSAAVSLMTIHSAKGLEFPYVFIPALSENVFPSPRLSIWYKRPELIPFSLRVDKDWLPQGFKTTTKEFEAYEQNCRDYYGLEERRLIYVALTRAEIELYVSGHWWGSTQKKPRGPSAYLKNLKDIALDNNQEIIWVENDLEENPNFKNILPTIWPTRLDEAKRQKRQEFAVLVKNAQDTDETELSEIEHEIINELDKDIDAILFELQNEKNIKKTVAIPDTLNVTKSIKLIRDSKTFAKQLVRPMPMRPIEQARRGTQFHYWIEKHFAIPALFDTLDLEGSADQDYVDDKKLDLLKKAFLKSPWATMKPLALEWPFEISIEGRSLRGRIDAVFKSETGILLIDWKTGMLGNSDDLQLAWYRHAWWKYHGGNPDLIKAGFVYIPSMEFAEEKNGVAVDDSIFKFQKLDVTTGK
jgi:DNA helicase-2/ATP-dependent DNA helicase PcrA